MTIPVNIDVALTLLVLALGCCAIALFLNIRVGAMLLQISRLEKRTEKHLNKTANHLEEVKSLLEKCEQHGRI